MRVGVVKLRPPIDGEPAFISIASSAPGFHIYDVGFQSPNVEPLTCGLATALLLVLVIVALNLTAIVLRTVCTADMVFHANSRRYIRARSHGPDEIMSEAVIGPQFAEADVCLRVRDLRHYGSVMALDRIACRASATVFIGPQVRQDNAVALLQPDERPHRARARQCGVLFEGEDIYGADVDPYTLRRRIGMVFQKPNPFPKSVYENVAFGLRLEGINARSALDERVEWALRSAALWDEVKDRLDAPALGLSGGQQQRLVIARAIAIRPSILLLDEPASSLDPISVIEELISQSPVVHDPIVTHNMHKPPAPISLFPAHG